MAVSIGNFDVTIPGQVVRKHDPETDITTIRLDEDQARSIYADAAKIVGFLDQPPAINGSKSSEPELPLGG
jgi:hypothetical protein